MSKSNTPSKKSQQGTPSSRQAESKDSTSSTEASIYETSWAATPQNLQSDMSVDLCIALGETSKKINVRLTIDAKKHTLTARDCSNAGTVGQTLVRREEEIFSRPPTTSIGTYVTGSMILINEDYKPEVSQCQVKSASHSSTQSSTIVPGARYSNADPCCVENPGVSTKLNVSTGRGKKRTFTSLPKRLRRLFRSRNHVNPKKSHQPQRKTEEDPTSRRSLPLQIEDNKAEDDALAPCCQDVEERQATIVSTAQSPVSPTAFTTNRGEDRPSSPAPDKLQHTLNAKYTDQLKTNKPRKSRKEGHDKQHGEEVPKDGRNLPIKNLHSTDRDTQVKKVAHTVQGQEYVMPTKTRTVPASTSGFFVALDGDQPCRPVPENIQKYLISRSAESPNSSDERRRKLSEEVERQPDKEYLIYNIHGYEVPLKIGDNTTIVETSLKSKSNPSEKNLMFSTDHPARKQVSSSLQEDEELAVTTPPNVTYMLNRPWGNKRAGTLASQRYRTLRSSLNNVWHKAPSRKRRTTHAKIVDGDNGEKTPTCHDLPAKSLENISGGEDQEDAQDGRHPSNSHKSLNGNLTLVREIIDSDQSRQDEVKAKSETGQDINTYLSHSRNDDQACNPVPGTLQKLLRAKRTDRRKSSGGRRRRLLEERDDQQDEENPRVTHEHDNPLNASENMRPDETRTLQSVIHSESIRTLWKQGDGPLFEEYAQEEVEVAQALTTDYNQPWKEDRPDTREPEKARHQLCAKCNGRPRTKSHRLRQQIPEELDENNYEEKTGMGRNKVLLKFETFAESAETGPNRTKKILPPRSGHQTSSSVTRNVDVPPSQVGKPTKVSVPSEPTNNQGTCYDKTNRSCSLDGTKPREKRAKKNQLKTPLESPAFIWNERQEKLKDARKAIKEYNKRTRWLKK